MSEHCDGCGRLVPSDELQEVQTLRATMLSPAEWEALCPSCARMSDEQMGCLRDDAADAAREDRYAQ